MRILIGLICISLLLLLGQNTSFAQEDGDLLSMLDEDQEEVNYTSAAFKTNRIINLHSIEHTSHGVLDVKISHRFGFIDNGFYDLFGLDNATIRIGGDYGITENLQIGVGRSSYEKTYDGYLKWRILRQKSGAENSPLSISLFASTAIKTINWPDQERQNYFSSRLYYTFQLLLGRKFSENFTLQLSPTLVHRNIVETSDLSNDVLAVGIGARQKITKRISLNLEYIPIIPSFQDDKVALSEEYTPSISIGFDIETGGHVFQLHFTNSTSMIEKGFITETTGRWKDLGVHFGFNVSRVFTIYSPNMPE